MRDGLCFAWKDHLVLRKVVGKDEGYDYLECGHEVKKAFPENGAPIGTYRRQCYDCGPSRPNNPFFPPRGSIAAKYIAEAKLICVDCPVRQTCEDYAIEKKIRSGIYGGKTHTERQGTKTSDTEDEE
jgi:hypothetical protein